MKFSGDRQFDESAEAVISDYFIGVYWTLPADNRLTLPKDAGEAAKLSFTIREQRKEIARQAALRGLRRAAEFALQIDHYGINEEDRDQLIRIREFCEKGDTVVFYTHFSVSGNWRSNTQLDRILMNAAAPFISVEAPSEEVIEHFQINRHWENVRRQARANLRAKRRNRISVNRAMLDFFHGYMASRLADIRGLEIMSDSDVARKINGMGLYTITGRQWDSDSVRALRRTLLK